MIKNKLYTNSKHHRTKLQSKQHNIKLSSQIWFHQSFIFYKNVEKIDPGQPLGLPPMLAMAHQIVA